MSSSSSTLNEKAFSLTKVLLDEEKRIADLIKNKETEDDGGLNPYEGYISDSEVIPRELLNFRRDRSEVQRDALCFSGGGIRSACICLGVAQGLAGLSLLRKFHYLSTVSGGGYIGCWLSTWINTVKKRGGKAELIEESLSSPAQGREAPEISNLRVNSNYLTPRKGALSVDLFTCLMILARNLIVNWLVLIPFFAFCLAWLMLNLLAGSALIDGLGDAGRLFAGMAVLCLVINGLIALYVMPGFKKAQQYKSKVGLMSVEYQQLMACRWTLAFLASFLLAIWIRTIKAPLPDDFIIQTPDYLFIYAIIVLPYLFGIRRAYSKQADVGCDTNSLSYWPKILVAFILSAVASYAIARGLISVMLHTPTAIARFFHPVHPLFQHTLYLAIAPAGWTLLFEFQNFLMVGCLSMLTNDEDREWWSRSNAIVALLALAWLAGSVITVYGPVFSDLLALDKTRLWGALVSQFSLGGIVALLANSAKTPATTKDRPAPVRMALLQVAGVLFFILLAMLLATANYHLAANIAAHGKADTITVPIQLEHPADETIQDGQVHIEKTDSKFAVTASFGLKPKSDSIQAVTLAGADWWWVLLLWASVTLVASWIVNINQFSVQCLYRNRLLRCFVGAVRRAYRRNQAPGNQFEPFTGFDTSDNYDVQILQHQLPFHVINMTQNLIKPTNLAWQQRMASSFTASPLYTGGELTGYRRTSEFGQGISIGTAIATSGAAANPSMGHCTSPLLELLMTLFNLRLGWWVGNPEDPKVSRQLGPGFALEPLLSEMFGQTSEGQKYVLLSDGGHFEDLAIYEMIQRRCRFLLVVDGGADPTGNFEDLGNAVRKVRIDLGVEIDFLFNRTSPKLAGTKEKRQHFAVAKIFYSKADGTPLEQDGWLLYIKCILNGDESEDIYQYKRFYKDFPHQSTMEQWFDEAQFESYRALGQHSIAKTLEAVTNYSPKPDGSGGQHLPGSITDEELGDRKADFVEFQKFLIAKGFIAGA